MRANGQYLIISDLEAAMLRLKVKDARHRIRDEQNKETWVNDKLLGLTPEHLKNDSVGIEEKEEMDE